MKKILFILFSLCLLGGAFSFNSASAQTEEIQIDYFYSATCPICAQEKEFLKTIEEKYPEVVIKSYEVMSSSENQKLLRQFYEDYNVPENEWGWVPVTFTPTKYFVGFHEQIGQEIESCLKECLGAGETAPQNITLPLFGQIDASKFSLPALTIAFGAVDGFNPCAMWVLLFLIALLINMRSRKRMWLVAGTFLFVSGLVYFLILSAWLNLFLAISYVNLTRILIGILAIGVGVWQVKNFITYNPGVCKVLGVKSKIEQSLQNRAQKIVSSPFTFAMVGGVIFLALGVNLVEFFCSAGLPTIYTRILAMSNLNTLNYHMYLLLYTFVFMLDDLLIFAAAIITFNKVGFGEKYNYWTTLIGGLLIMVLGFLLIFKPELLMFH